MSLITTLTRMWLTRTTKPFTFQNEYDQTLPYSECDGLGLYVHIPFCKSICSFCPYCKVVYSGEKCDRYIDSLLREIETAPEVTAVPAEVPGSAGGRAVPYIAGIAGAAAAGAGLLIFKKRKHD